MLSRDRIILGLIFGLALSLLFFGDDLAHLFTKNPSSTFTAFEIGELVDSKGHITRRSQQSDKNEKLESPLKESQTLRHLDQLTVAADSSATVVVSGYKLLLTGPSRLIFELWNPNEITSPRFLNVLEGDFQMLTQGEAGQLYIVRDGQVFAPSQKPVKKTPVLVVDRSASTPESEEAPEQEALEEESSQDETKKEPTDEAGARGLPSLKPKKILSADGRLSNEYLKEKLHAQSNRFRKCQTNSLRANQAAVGDLLVAMTVSSRGQVSQVKVIQSTLTDAQMQECAVSVLERLQFQAFSGPDVMVSYPLKFR